MHVLCVKLGVYVGFAWCLYALTLVIVRCYSLGALGIGAWSFSGVWCLELGVLPLSPITPHFIRTSVQTPVNIDDSSLFIRTRSVRDPYNRTVCRLPLGPNWSEFRTWPALNSQISTYLSPLQTRYTKFTPRALITRGYKPHKHKH
jgi:hypothetical protein